MKGLRIFVTFMMLLFCALQSGAQTVGLVLSGGGAKGLYHVGILKALEENNVPIDYVSGASMGSIVAGLYAMGYSPEDMVRFFESDSVSNWLAGEIPPEYRYFFRKEGTSPEMVTINIKTKKATTKGTSGVKLPTSLLSASLLDLAFMNMMEGASWAAHENFDSLMVPFRCVASDLYNKKTITFRDGSLPFAIRSSMAIPLVFKPMKYDSVLIYDGGVLNNFPWQCLKDDFNPDVLIGCICAGNEENPAEDDIYGQIMTMITNHTDYNLPDDRHNITIKRRFSDVSTLDYGKASYIIQKGYDDASAMMPEILEKISRRSDSIQLKVRRDTFRRKIKPLVFDRVDIDGVTDAQKSYIFHQLCYEEGHDYDAKYFEQKYIRMIGAGIFEGSFPEVTFNPETGKYQLRLKMTTKPSLKFSFGGNISSTSLNQAYLGFTYSYVNRLASSYFTGGLLGTFYNSFYAGGRHDIYTNFPFYLQYHYAWEQYDYTTNHMARYLKDQNFEIHSSISNTINITLGASAFSNYVFKVNWTGGKSVLKYYPGAHISSETLDETKFLYSRLDLQLEKNSLNYTMYPTLGKHFKCDFRFYSGVEDYLKGNSIYSELNEPERFTGKNRTWVEGEVLFENYHYLSKWFNLGYIVDAKVSNVPDFGTELATSFMKSQFSPIPHSETMFMHEYRSGSHLAFGMMPIVKFTQNQKFFLKTYAYCYLPQEIFFDGDWVSPTDRFHEYVRGIFGGSLVYQTPVGPASITYNKYTTGPHNWSLMVNFGYAIFRTRTN